MKLTERQSLCGTSGGGAATKGILSGKQEVAGLDCGYGHGDFIDAIGALRRHSPAKVA